MSISDTRRIVAEYCPGCGETHHPQQPSTGEYCQTCRHYHLADLTYCGRHLPEERAAQQEENTR